MRQIARLVNVTDLIGLIGLIIVAFAAGQYDPRATWLVVGVALILLALARAQPSLPSAPPVQE